MYILVPEEFIVPVVFSSNFEEEIIDERAFYRNNIMYVNELDSIKKESGEAVRKFYYDVSKVSNGLNSDDILKIHKFIVQLTIGALIDDIPCLKHLKTNGYQGMSYQNLIKKISDDFQLFYSSLLKKVRARDTRGDESYDEMPNELKDIANYLEDAYFVMYYEIKDDLYKLSFDEIVDVLVYIVGEIISLHFSNSEVLNDYFYKKGVSKDVIIKDCKDKVRKMLNSYGDTLGCREEKVIIEKVDAENIEVKEKFEEIDEEYIEENME